MKQEKEVRCQLSYLWAKKDKAERDMKMWENKIKRFHEEREKKGDGE